MSARNSTFTYKGKPVEVKLVSKELGVQYVLEGSVQKSGDRVQITAQLIDARTGRHLWAERYESDLTDKFALKDRITLKILLAMRVKFVEGEHESIYSVEKYWQVKNGPACYLKAVEGINNLNLMSLEANIKAKRLAEDMVGLCAEHPGVIISRLGTLYGFSVWLHEVPAESFEKAMALNQKVLAISDFQAEPHALLGLLLITKGEYEKGIAEGERALSLDPGGAFTNELYGGCLLSAGRPKEALPLFQKAIRLNPYSPASAFFWLGRAYMQTGRLGRAVSANRKGLLLAPDYIGGHLILGRCGHFLGREKEARVEAAEVLRINPQFSLEHFARGVLVDIYGRPRPNFNKSGMEKFVGALRKAGLK